MKVIEMTLLKDIKALSTVVVTPFKARLGITMRLCLIRGASLSITVNELL